MIKVSDRVLQNTKSGDCCILYLCSRVGADIGGEQQVGDGSGGAAGDLLRHGSVVGA